MVKAIGPEEFARQVEEEWQDIKDGPGTLTEAELQRVAAYFTAPAYANLPETDSTFVSKSPNRAPKIFRRVEAVQWMYFMTILLETTNFECS